MGRALHIARNGVALGIEAPLPSAISTHLPSTLLHSKHWIIDPRAKHTNRWASAAPGQARRPNPNGINFLSSPCSSNLSGLNLSGSFHNIGSLCMAHTLVNNIVPRGISYPVTLQSFDDMRATSNGSAGYRRNVSDTIFWRQGRFTISCSSTNPSEPVNSSISILALLSISGWFNKFDIAHSSVTDAVFVPATIKTCQYNSVNFIYVYISIKCLLLLKSIKTDNLIVYGSL